MGHGGTTTGRPHVVLGLVRLSCYASRRRVSGSTNLSLNSIDVLSGFGYGGSLCGL